MRGHTREALRVDKRSGILADSWKVGIASRKQHDALEGRGRCFPSVYSRHSSDVIIACHRGGYADGKE